MEVNQATFARMAGVSRAAINSKIVKGTLVLNSAGKLDTDNPLNRAYLDSKQDALRQPITPAISLTKNVGVEKNINDTPKEMMEMTLRELVQKHGSLAGVDRYVKILRDLSTADEKIQRMQERRQEQIPKDFVITRLFSYLNQLSNNILDVPESITDQIIALVQSNPDNCRNKVITTIRDYLSRCIGGSKEAVIKELNGLREKYDDTAELLVDKIDEMMERNNE